MKSVKTTNVVISAFALIALGHLSSCVTSNQLQKENFIISSQKDVKPSHKIKDLQPWEGFRGWSPRNPY